MWKTFMIITALYTYNDSKIWFLTPSATKLATKKVQFFFQGQANDFGIDELLNFVLLQ